MRADRLLSILLLLQVHRRVTAGGLAERLEVCGRTIYRDMKALGAAGILITAERGRGGGQGLREAYRTDLTGLNGAEIQTLFLGTLSRLHADLGLGQAAEAALIKLLAALHSVSRLGAEDIRQRIFVDGAGWRQQEGAVQWLPLLQDAIRQARKLLFTYGTAGSGAAVGNRGPASRPSVAPGRLATAARHARRCGQ